MRVRPLRNGHCCWLLDRGYFRGQGCSAKGVYRVAGAGTALFVERQFCAAHLARVQADVLICVSRKDPDLVGEHGKRVKRAGGKRFCRCCGKEVE